MARASEKHFQVVETPYGMTWVNISAPTTRTLAKLKRRFPFLLDVDVENCLPPFQRPKLLEREGYLFMVLIFPIYKEDTKTIVQTEVDFFVGKDFVVTSHEANIPVLMRLANDCSLDPEVCKREIGKDPADMLYTVLHNLLSGVFPILTKLSNDLITVEKEVFNESDHETVREILRIKSNIVQCRQSMQSHKFIIRKFIDRAEALFDTEDLQVFYEDLVGHTKEIWDYLENDKETINAIYDSHISMMSYATNDAAKKIGALALVMLPTTLIATIFGMNVSMPFTQSASGFLVVLGMIVFVTLVTIVYLRKQRWL